MLNFHSSTEVYKAKNYIPDQTNCPSYPDCSAPLCPLDTQSINKSIWYNDEPICCRRNPPHWIKTQIKIKKAKAPNNRYFTLAMLKAVNRVQKGISGISPDQPLNNCKEVERTWIRERLDRKPKIDTAMANSIACKTCNR